MIVVALVLISEIVRPLYRPLVRYVAELSLVRQLDTVVASLPRSAVLILFAVPFAVAEPLKIYALVLIARHHVLVGLAIILFAYLMSFLIVERIFHAGREKLLTFQWLKWLVDRIGTIRLWVHDIAGGIADRARGLLRLI